MWQVASTEGPPDHGLQPALLVEVDDALPISGKDEGTGIDTKKQHAESSSPRTPNPSSPSRSSSAPPPFTVEKDDDLTTVVVGTMTPYDAQSLQLVQEWVRTGGPPEGPITPPSLWPGSGEWEAHRYTYPVSSECPAWSILTAETTLVRFSPY